jgi:uncharacterized protein (DUF1697 family)
LTANRYVALLRGINVGRNKQLAMVELARVMEGLGYDDVKTYLRSGQVVFSADAAATAAAAERLAADIDDAITEHLGMDVRVVVRTRSELAALLKANPFTDRESDPTKLFCVFLSHQLTKSDLAGLDPATYEPEQLALARGGRDLYLWLPNGMGVSVLGAVRWERVTGQKSLVATARNWRTTTKLLELLDA